MKRMRGRTLGGARARGAAWMAAGLLAVGVAGAVAPVHAGEVDGRYTVHIGQLRIEDGLYVLDPVPGLDDERAANARDVLVLVPARSPYGGSVARGTRGADARRGQRFDDLSCAFDSSPRCAGN